MALTLAQYVAQVRAFVDDTTTSHRFVEDLTNFVIGGNGARKSFSLSKQNLVTGKTLADVNKAGFTSTGFTTDDTNGTITFSVAPPLSSTVPTSLEVMSYYQEFTDADITPFVDYGLNKIGVNPSIIDNSYENVSTPNMNVVCLYAASQAYATLASRYTKYVDTSAEGKSSSKSAIAAGYLKSSQEFEARADAERVAVQGQRQGRSTVANLTNTPIRIRASRWTPTR